MNMQTHLFLVCHFSNLHRLRALSLSDLDYDFDLDLDLVAPILCYCF